MRVEGDGGRVRVRVGREGGVREGVKNGCGGRKKQARRREKNEN